ncbi:MAG: hypothetical protein E7392_03960 [Ruminococcaceae bacterium]|nr:hypothetical protein [Oscillospiraceae bacterium]
MKLPVIRKENKYRKSMITFGGLNFTHSFSDGEMTDCTAISHYSFPAITQRQKSELVFACESPTAGIYGNKECIAAQDGLYYDREKVCELTPGKKQLAFLGSKVVVFPDKIYYDTKTKSCGDLQGECDLSNITVTFSDKAITVPESKNVITQEFDVCKFPKDAQLITYSTAVVKSDGITFQGFSLKNAGEVQAGTILYEKCDSNQYRVVESTALTEDGRYYIVTSELITVKNVIEGIFNSINSGDVVEISGCTINSRNNKSITVVSRTKTSLRFAEGSFTEGEETGRIIIKRKIPDFTCICSYENRLWGCEGNTVYASALGDVTNFFVYNNLSTDSFTVESNTAGDFTACVAYGNCCLFFKENSCFKLYGNRPANFTLIESFAGGISSEDADSLVNVGGNIIYKGNRGIYAFSGGLPRCISRKIEGLSMKNSVAGSDGRRYYITAETEKGREEFVWDIEKNLWSKSGNKSATGYFSCGGNIYRLTKEGVEEITQQSDDEAVWSITFCPFDEGYFKTKNYSRLHIKVHLFEDAYIKTEVSYDGGEWLNIDTSYGNEKKYINIPCVIKSCHEVQLRLSGKGKSVIESITREFSVN